MQNQYPILEFDHTREAVINPANAIEPVDMPEHFVPCFFQDIIGKLYRYGKARPIAEVYSEAGPRLIYELSVGGQRLGLFHPGIGAPQAAGTLEEVIARGGKKFIACGGSGVLDKDIAVGHIVVPDSAVRDEGTSYHYLPPSREVSASHEGVAAIERVLTERGHDYIVSKTWTTDAFYRETPDKVRLRKSEGCLTVEMEAAAFFAVAQFRDVTFAQMLYGGDDVSGTKHDTRNWTQHTSTRESLFWLAAEACLSL